MTPLWQGVLLGLVAATGLLVVLTRIPAFRRPRLEDRLAPYLRDTPRPSRLLTGGPALTPFPAAERLLRPVLRDLADRVERWVGGSVSVRRRLAAAGSDLTLEQFRTEQVLWAFAGLLGGLGLLALRLTTGTGLPPVSLLALSLAAVVAGLVGRDYALTRAVARREEAILTELPTVAELLALSVAAGESPLGALERLTRLSRGELAREFRRALAEARAGATFVQALGGIAQRTSLPAVARFVDGMTVAIERGTPLADVLRAQAVDVREASRRALLEAGGRKEIAMMIPVVFLVLPVTVVFALFPGALQFTVITR